MLRRLLKYCSNPRSYHLTSRLGTPQKFLARLPSPSPPCCRREKNFVWLTRVFREWGKNPKKSLMFTPENLEAESLLSGSSLHLFLLFPAGGQRSCHLSLAVWGRAPSSCWMRNEADDSRTFFLEAKASSLPRWSLNHRLVNHPTSNLKFLNSRIRLPQLLLVLPGLGGLFFFSAHPQQQTPPCLLTTPPYMY